MSKSIWRNGLAAAAFACAAVGPAHAAVVTFEDVLPTLVGPGESVVSSGYRFESLGGAFLPPSGFSQIDTAENIIAGVPAGGATGQFLAALNDDTLFVRNAGGFTFRLNSFSTAFLAPIQFIGIPGVAPAFLGVVGATPGGGVVTEFYTFPVANPQRNFGFATLSAAGGLVDLELSGLGFFACADLVNGQCFLDQSVPMQYGLDNLNLTEVPEPATTALFLGALAGLAVARRRRSAR